MCCVALPLDAAVGCRSAHVCLPRSMQGAADCVLMRKHEPRAEETERGRRLLVKVARLRTTRQSSSSSTHWHSWLAFAAFVGVSSSGRWVGSDFGILSGKTNDGPHPDETERDMDGDDDDYLPRLPPSTTGHHTAADVDQPCFDLRGSKQRDSLLPVPSAPASPFPIPNISP